MVIKVVLSILILVILIGFFIKSQFSKTRSVAEFYSNAKLAKHTAIIGVGVVFLALAFLVDFLSGLYMYEVILVVLRHLFGLIALICFGYGYYKEIRQK